MLVSFVQEQRRNRGYGRALLESIEEIARFLKIERLLLCSTDDPETKVGCVSLTVCTARQRGARSADTFALQETWKKLGFVYTTEEDLAALGILHTDLLHMDNTVQMQKKVPPASRWKSVVFR